MAAPQAGGPLVSVIVPFYERRNLLPGVIATLQAQTYTQFELIIVDDGSRDGLGEAVSKLRTEFPVRFIRLEENRGAATARNVGFDAAAGRYVALLDSDDSWHPDKLRLQVQQLDSSSGGKLVSLTRQLVRGSRLHVMPARPMTERDQVGRYLFLDGGVIQSSMMMMSRDLAVQTRFEDGARGHDDWCFAIRLQENGARFAMLERPLTIYDDTEGRARLSPIYSSARLDWLRKRRTQLGDQAYWAAVAAIASRLPRDEEVSPPRLIITAYRNGAIGAARAGYYLAAQAFPPLRTLARHARQRWSGAATGDVSAPAKGGGETG